MKIKYLTMVVVFGAMFFLHGALAQEQSVQVDYEDQPVVDSDLDGLTDKGEIQIYHTDPNNADTDGDGFSDGVEVTAGTDPLLATSYPGAPAQTVAASQTAPVQAETPWAWYVSRASALVSFVLLYISIFLGLTIRIPLLRKIVSPVYSVSAHCWISLQATIFALIHGLALMFDKTFHFGLASILVPFASSYEPGLVAMGTVAFYLMIALVATSYGRKYMSQKVWRMTHSFNILLYAFGIIHAMRLGTDLKDPLVWNIFVWANALLIIIMLYNVELRMADAMRIRAEKKLRESQGANEA